MKIEKLTTAQERELPVFRAEYLIQASAGYSTDREALEGALEKAYAVIGKSKPLLIILQSPQQAMMAIKFFEHFAKEQQGKSLRDQLGGQLRDQLGGQLGDQLGDQLWDQLGGQLWDQLRDQLGGQLRNQLRDQLRDQLWDQLRNQLRDQLGDQLRDQLGGQLWDQLRGQLWDQLRNQLRDQLGDQLRNQLWGQLWGQLGGQSMYNDKYLWGSQDLYWIAWGKFAEKIGVKYTKKQSEQLEIMHQIGFQCEWWWPYEGICFVSERPKVRWDEDRRLHCETGPAVQYADGYKLYTWHGTVIPEEWIENRQSLKPEVALKWENLDQRRAACELIGWASILDQLKAKVIDQDNDLLIGTLVEVDLPDSGKERFLRVKCGTGRDFALIVPPTVKTAIEANMWTYSLNPEDYAIEVRT